MFPIIRWGERASDEHSRVVERRSPPCKVSLFDGVGDDGGDGDGKKAFWYSGANIFSFRFQHDQCCIYTRAACLNKWLPTTRFVKWKTKVRDSTLPTHLSPNIFKRKTHWRIISWWLETSLKCLLQEMVVLPTTLYRPHQKLSNHYRYRKFLEG